MALVLLATGDEGLIRGFLAEGVEVLQARSDTTLV